MALKVAEAVEKIRVNPGNFADGRKTFDEVLYETDEEYFAERAYIEETFKPLVLKCKELNRMIRIGTRTALQPLPSHSPTISRRKWGDSR